MDWEIANSKKQQVLSIITPQLYFKGENRIGRRI